MYRINRMAPVANHLHHGIKVKDTALSDAQNKRNGKERAETPDKSPVADPG
jgi:hypothetical protein